MGVYTGMAQDNVTINSGKATLQTLTVTGALTASGGVTGDVAGNITLSVATVAAAGSDNTDAAAVTAYGVVHATGADGTKGVKLPTAAAGKVVIVKNADAANAILKVYPGASDKINSGTATTGVLSMAAKTAAMFVAINDVDWFTVPLLPS
jgi:hypothetical protein